MKKIKVKYKIVDWRVSEKLKDLPTINSNQVTAIQGDLKDLADSEIEKLVKSFNAKGVFIPLFVWYDEENDVNYSLDGHQRLRIIQELYPGGKHLPYVPIEAESYNDAKERLLLIDSKYGVVTKDGFDSYIVDMDNGEDFAKEFTTFESFTDFDTPAPPPDSNDNGGDGSGGNDQGGLNKELKKKFALEIECADEEEQKELFEELTDREYTVKILNL